MHASRLETLFHYHDMLPGNTSKMMANNDEAALKRKRILFHSFPADWQIEFNKQYPNGYADPTVQWNTIVEFMRGWRVYLNAKKTSEERRAERRRGPGQRNQQGYQSSGRNNRGYRPYRNSSTSSNQNRPYPNYQNYPRYQGNQGNAQRNFQPRGNFQRNFQHRGNGGRFQNNFRRNNGGQGQRNQQQRSNFNRNDQRQVQQQHNMEQHYSFVGQGEHELYMNDGDAIDQSWSNPDGANPEWNAEGSTEMYNNEQQNDQYYYSNTQQEQSQFDNNTDDHFYFQHEETPQDFANPQFDDAYYYDQDYQY